ncbi:MAG: hypothetical protein II575_08870, partial [Bacteroidales bacterium]|nr:hypothetical protein [Bacteroidales bacterium]
MKDTIIKYFNRKRNIAAFLVFVYAFAIGFIFLVNPFNVKSWVDWEDTDDYVITVLSVVGIGFFVLLVSRSLMYILRNKVVLNFKGFLIWVAGELAVLSAFYTLFAHEYDIKYIGQGYFDIFPRIFMYVALLLLVVGFALLMTFVVTRSLHEVNFATLQELFNNTQAEVTSLID